MPSKKLKITHISTSLGGGAGKAVLRLHEGLDKNTIDSAVLSLNHYPAKEGVFTYPSLLSNTALFVSEQKNLLFKVQKVFNKSSISINSTYFTLASSAYKNVHQLPLIQQTDILHFHWVSNFIDLKSFLKKTNQPIVWTLHDMNPFTAGYHYIPTPDELATNKKTLQKLENQKINLFKDKQINFTYTSKYMGALLKNSKIGQNFPSFHIPLGLDTTVFSPRDKQFSKSLLGIPTDKKIVLVVGDDLKVARKGFSYIKDCIEHIEYPKKDLLFCVLGNCDLSIFPKEFPIKHLGFFHDELLMSMVYSSADVFVTTAVQEAFGQTTIEALCCGLPVIGFPVGVIPQAIIPNKNGMICEEISAAAIAECITNALNAEWDMEWIRTDASKKYNLQTQASAYQKLYKELV